MESFSRREFFTKLIPKPKKDGEISRTSEVTNPETAPTTLSRRDFLAFIGAMGAVATMEYIGVNTAEAKEIHASTKEINSKSETSINKNEELPLLQDVQLKQESDENSYTETMIDQSLMIVAKRIAGAIFDALKIEHGNKAFDDNKIIEYLRDKPLDGLINGSIVAPIIEEALFRAIPSVLSSAKDSQQRWDVGIPTSILFALVHNVKKEDAGGLQFVKSIPITQFMGGLFYWYLMREKGYGHAVFAHSMNNAIPLSIGALLFKAYPEEQALKKYKKTFG